MYERFTDRARKVMQLANQEAQRFNHEYIDTGHVLIGLVKEGTGVAASIFKNLGIDIRMARIAVEKLMQAGPEMVTMGKIPQTPRTRRAIEYAVKEAAGLQHNYVGTEHILLGLMAEGEGVAAQALMNLGLTYTRIRDGIIEILKGPNPRQEMKDSIVIPVEMGRVPEQVKVASELPTPAPYAQEEALSLIRAVRETQASLNEVAIAWAEARNIAETLQEETRRATERNRLAKYKLEQYLESAK